MDTHSGATTQRRACSAPGRYTLSQWDKGRFHGGMGRNTKRQPHREKMRNDAQLLESPGYARRSAEEMENCELFFMHHKCNII